MALHTVLLSRAVASGIVLSREFVCVMSCPSVRVLSRASPRVGYCVVPRAFSLRVEGARRAGQASSMSRRTAPRGYSRAVKVDGVSCVACVACAHGIFCYPCASVACVVCVCGWVCACVRACVLACACACARVCVVCQLFCVCSLRVSPVRSLSLVMWVASAVW